MLNSLGKKWERRTGAAPERGMAGEEREKRGGRGREGGR
jgi:hypothetical protein